MGPDYRNLEDQQPQNASTILGAIPILPARGIGRAHALQQIAGPQAPQLLELTADSIVIGRGVDADISIASTALSRQHVRLERYQGGYRAIDLNSANGVFLDQIRFHTAVLRQGDTLQIGDAVFIYHRGT